MRNSLPKECRFPSQYIEIPSSQQMEQRTHKKQTPKQETQKQPPPSQGKLSKQNNDNK